MGTRILLSQLSCDADVQSRAELNKGVVDDYARAIAEGALLPGISVVFDGTTHWVADGFHRFAAASRLGHTSIDCDVRQGSKNDAIVFSACANAKHGLRRSNADKRRAVAMLLDVPEWATRSDRQIAEACAVSNHLVADVRGGNSPTASTRSTSDGRYYPAHRSSHPSDEDDYIDDEDEAELREKDLLAQMKVDAIQSPNAENRWLRDYATWTDDDRIAEAQFYLWGCTLGGKKSPPIEVQQFYEQQFAEKGWDEAKCIPAHRCGTPQCVGESAHLAMTNALVGALCLN